MPAARHNPKVPELSPTSASARPPCHETWQELRTALDIIMAAAANLRHYRDRLSPDDHTATVRDIEQAAEQIASGLAMEIWPTRAATTDGKRKTR